MLLRAVAIDRDGRKPMAVSGGDIDNDLSNILARAGAPPGAGADAIAAEVRTARVVQRRNLYARRGPHLVGMGVRDLVAVLHLIRPSRGRIVPEEVFGAVRPSVWVSDAFGSQRGHAEQ